MDKSFSQEQTAQFVNMVRNIVYDVVSQMNLRIEKYYDGIILSADNDKNVASVDIGDIRLDDISNKTGLALTAGDGVRVYSASPTLTDAYIGIRFNHNNETEG